MNEFSTVLKIIRRESGLNQRDFAEKIGMKPAAYNMVESGKNQPSYIVMSNLIRVFQIDANRLFPFYDVGEKTTNGNVDSTTSNKIQIKVDINNEAEFLNQVHDRIRKVEVLYQRLIDVRLLLFQELRLKGELSTSSEANLLNTLARPEIRIEDEETELIYPYENLTIEGKTEYLGKLESCFQLFMNTFFECFEQLYRGIHLPITKDLREIVLSKREKLTNNFTYSHYIKHHP